MLPAAVGAASALLALSTLGLTWVRRTVEGPLGEASAAQVEALSGREVAPLVTALVPGAAAVVVVALLLRGWWRAGALVLGALAAAGAAVGALEVLLPGGAGAGGAVTATPVVAAGACLLAAAGALAGAVATVRTRRAPVRPVAGRSGVTHVTPAAGAGPSPTPRPDDPPAGGTVATTGSEPADLWRALDDGRDPT